MPIPLQNITVRSISNTVGQLTTIIAIVDHPGPPSRTFFHATQQPDNVTPGKVAEIERRAVTSATDQFLLWVQNGKPA